MITPAIEQALHQHWQQMREEAQQLTQSEGAISERARAASLSFLVDWSQREFLGATSDTAFIGRCLELASGLRTNSERSISTLKEQPREQDVRWQERLGRMQGALTALQEYEVFPFQLLRPARDENG